MDAWWHEVWVTLQAEFADIGDARQLTQITVRLLIAAILGGILGYEREQKGKAAGVRTHMLVALGAALFVLVPSMSGSQADAMSRVLQGVIAGIGFLGAGTILKGKEDEEGQHVKGLTTAAGLWMTAAIGVAAGSGAGIHGGTQHVVGLGGVQCDAKNRQAIGKELVAVCFIRSRVNGVTA